MANIVVCYKWVVDEADITVNADQTLNMDRVAGKISDYDKNAIEAGVEMKAAMGGTLYGLTFGGEESKASLKDALSRGLDEVVWVHGAPPDGVDAALTGRALVEGLAQVPDLGLVICGDGSNDQYARQIQSRLAALLQVPVVTSVVSMHMEGDVLVAVRALDDMEEVVELTLPAVVSILPELCGAPVPGLKSVMSAKKKPVIDLPLCDTSVSLLRQSETVSTLGYEMKRKNIMLQGTSGEEIVDQLLTALEKEGIF